MVGGFKIIGEKRVETNALAVITLLVNDEYVCDLTADNEEKAYLLFIGEHPYLNVVESSVEKLSEENGIFKYKVRIKHRLEVR